MRAKADVRQRRWFYGFTPWSARPPHKTRIEFLHRARAALLHGRARFGAHELQHPLDALLAEGPQPPQIGTADADRLRAHGERLDGIGAAAKSAVDDHGHSPFHRRDDLGQRVDGGAAIVLAAPAGCR